ncbi:uncharacterized protein LOC101012382 [Papio anubis]|uniref:uncharacterized protein LOC101012382 n=1 Tax=Papio anubis TaxID=9555 RepID=UPI0012AD4BC2|nr:uncharacterized protein LOC101012382 [Papio anubis]
MRRNSWGSPSQDSWRSAFPEAYKSAGPCLGSHGTPASANKTGSRNGQRQRSLTVWKAEISGADCLGAPSIRTAPLGGSKERTAICFSTGAQDSSQRAPFRRQNPGQLPQTSVRNLVPSIVHTAYHAIFNPRTWLLLCPRDIWGTQGPEKGRKITHAGALSPQVKLRTRNGKQGGSTEAGSPGVTAWLSLECTPPTSTQSSPQLTLPSSASSIKGNDPYCLTIAHVKSVLTFS